MNAVGKLLTLSGAQQKELAIAVGVSQPTVSDWVHQKKDPSGERLNRVAEFFGVSWRVVKCLEPIRQQPESSENAVKVPVLGTIPAGIPLEAIQDVLDWEEIPAAMVKGGQEYFALRVSGLSMYPEYRDGDTVVVRRQETCETGQDVVAMVNSDDATFKRFRQTPNGIMLQAINPNFESYAFTRKEVNELPVKILGVVVELRRKL